MPRKTKEQKDLKNKENNVKTSTTNTKKTSNTEKKPATKSKSKSKSKSSLLFAWFTGESCRGVCVYASLWQAVAKCRTRQLQYPTMV